MQSWGSGFRTRNTIAHATFRRAASQGVRRAGLPVSVTATELVGPHVSREQGVRQRYRGWVWHTAAALLNGVQQNNNQILE